MEPSLFAKLFSFARESVKKRVVETFGGFCMGMYSGSHILFAGVMATLVGPIWFAVKFIGTVFLAFCSAVATSYGSELGKKIFQNKKSHATRSQKGSRKKTA